MSYRKRKNHIAGAATVVGAACLALAMQSAGAAGAAPDDSTKAARQPGGNADSFEPAISADGRHVAFHSWASNLVPDDYNGQPDVFVQNLRNGILVRASIAMGGGMADGASQSAAISADGRYVAFSSWASNLVPDDSNGQSDIFVRDLKRGTTQRVSVAIGAVPGLQPDNASMDPSISADGRYVAYHSWATNLVTGDTNGTVDVFVRDLKRGTTQRVSVGGADEQANLDSMNPSISGDGRVIAFQSNATDLVDGDTNGQADVYVRDLDTQTTRRVSISTTGGSADLDSHEPAISADDRYVAFQSNATDLVTGDTNNAPDIFVRDLRTGTVQRVSLGAGGAQANAGSLTPSISADGRYVAFQSVAGNLTENDTNDWGDIFVRDTQTGTTRRLSMSVNGDQADNGSINPSIDSDGGVIAFQSWATNLVEGDTNGVGDIFIREVWPTRMVSVGQ